MTAFTKINDESFIYTKSLYVGGEYREVQFEVATLEDVEFSIQDGEETLEIKLSREGDDETITMDGKAFSRFFISGDCVERMVSQWFSSVKLKRG